jgi:hypothetical protein
VTQSLVFEWVSQKIAAAAGWTNLVARGTVRLALKEMGLDPRTVGKKEMATALRNSLGRLLEMHQVADAKGLCERLEHELWNAQMSSSSVESPEDIFKRLAKT